MHTTDQWSGIFRYSSTPSLTQISCWYWEAMACVRSGSNTWLSAVTWLIWPSVIKNHSCRHSTFRTNCYGTFDWQPSRYLHWPTVFAWRNSYSKKSAIFYCDPFDGNVQKIVATPNPSSRKSCRWLGQLYVVSRTRKRRKNLRSTWYPIMIISQSKTFAIPGRTRSYHEVACRAVALPLAEIFFGITFWRSLDTRLN